jgi:hypothetical protein
MPLSERNDVPNRCLAKQGTTNGRDCHNLRMSIDTDSGTAVQRPAPRGRLAMATAALVTVNLVATFAALWLIIERDPDELLPQDVWTPFLFVLGAQAGLNGLFLIAFKRSRSVGVGVLAGTLLAALMFCLWLWFVVLPNFQ